MTTTIFYMTNEERAVIIGFYRSGVTLETIGFIMGVSEGYVKSIVDEYLKKKK